MTGYGLIKTAHIVSVGLSLGLFGLRGWWMLYAPARLQLPWVRVVPHLIDTVLLASAVALAVLSAQYPLREAWLTAKVGALLIYIGLGMIALHYGRTRSGRRLAWIAALLVYGYIIAVALQRNPLPFL
jgi:uncharacterized membrane protein SirB2